MNRLSALFRLTQRLPKDIRKQACNMARIRLHQRSVEPYNPKLIGLITEFKSLCVIGQCFVCHNPYLHYGFLDHLLGHQEKPWRDIECLECKKFIVEIKSTQKIGAEVITGGSYKMYTEMPIKPSLLVFDGLYIDANLNYHHNIPLLYEPKDYVVFPKKNGKSIILLNK